MLYPMAAGLREGKERKDKVMKEALGLIWANRFEGRRLSGAEKDWILEALHLAWELPWLLDTFALEQLGELASRREL